MNVSLTGRGIELTDPIKEYLQSAIDSLDKFNLDIISVNAVASKQSQGKKQGLSIQFTINSISGTTHTCPVRTSTLNHKIRNHSMKSQTIIKAIFS